MKFYASYSSNIKAELKMFDPNRHDRLIERPKPRYPKMPFQECEMNLIHRVVLYFPYFIQTIDIQVYLFSCVRLRAHLGF